VASAANAGADVMTVAEPVLDELGTTVTPQGLIGVAVLPAPPLEATLTAAGLVVVLHQVRDPGNAGTALRSADAAGADAVILTRGSVDPRNPKAVRASAGSLFHLPVIDDVAFDDVARACREHGLRLVAAAGDGDVPHTDVDFSTPAAVVFGNEAHGLPPHVRGACDIAARVPLHARVRPGYHGTAESLNLAMTVAVVAFEAARQRGGTASTRP